jgi:hypothetical protein
MVKDIINSIYPVSKQAVEKIESLIEIESYGKRETFIKRGQRNTREYFVLEGICRSYLLDPAGQEITISFFNSQSILSPLHHQNPGIQFHFELPGTDRSKTGFHRMPLNLSKLMIDHLDIQKFRQRCFTQ